MRKQNARDWQEQQVKDRKLADYKTEQLDLLYYAAFKRKSSYPSVYMLREVGLVDAADKLDAAYLLIEEAYALATGGYEHT